MTRKSTIAKRKVERQLRHRARTGGLTPREHVAHERAVVDARRASIRSGEAFLEAVKPKESVLESLIERDADGNVITDFADGENGADTYQPDTSLDCPKCGANGDEPCRKPNGRIADQRHKVRPS